MNVQGELLMAFGVAGPLALVAALAIVHFYRRAIGRAMRGASAGTIAARADAVERRAPKAALAYAVERLGRDASPPLWRDPSLAPAAVYAVGGLVFALVATILVFDFSGIEFVPVRTTAVLWGYAWPTVLTLNILWSGDRRRQIVVVAVYASVLALLCLWVGLATHSVATTIGGVELPAFVNPVIIWAITAAPSVYLLVFANRRIRAVGPVVLAFAVLLAAGVALSFGLFGTSVGLQAALAILTFTGLGAYAFLAIVAICGIAVGAPLGWLAVQAMARAYENRRVSAHALVTDSIWLLQSLMVCSSVAREAGPAWGAAGLASFAAYKLMTSLGFRLLGSRSRRQSRRLLLLRVFGFDRRSSRLFDLIASRWRYEGTIRLIAAPDLASRTIDPGKLFAFLRRRLGSFFIHDEAELADRLRALDDRRDPDRRFRVAELFCAGDVWRSAVKRLMADTHVVAMDLRSFSKRNEGCAFELQALLDVAPLERLVFLVDRATDVDLLKSILDARWSELAVASPNARLADPVCPLIEVERTDAAIVRRLVSAAGPFEEQAAAVPLALREA